MVCHYTLLFAIIRYYNTIMTLIAIIAIIALFSVGGVCMKWAFSEQRYAGMGNTPGVSSCWRRIPAKEWSPRAVYDKRHLPSVRGSSGPWGSLRVPLPPWALGSSHVTDNVWNRHWAKLRHRTQTDQTRRRWRGLVMVRRRSCLWARSLLLFLYRNKSKIIVRINCQMYVNWKPYHWQKW